MLDDESDESLAETNDTASRAQKWRLVHWPHAVWTRNLRESCKATWSEDRRSGTKVPAREWLQHSIIVMQRRSSSLRPGTAGNEFASWLMGRNRKITVSLSSSSATLVCLRQLSVLRSTKPPNQSRRPHHLGTHPSQCTSAEKIPLESAQ